MAAAKKGTRGSEFGQQAPDHRACDKTNAKCRADQAEVLRLLFGFGYVGDECGSSGMGGGCDARDDTPD